MCEHCRVAAGPHIAQMLQALSRLAADKDKHRHHVWFKSTTLETTCPRLVGSIVYKMGKRSYLDMLPIYKIFVERI